MAQHIDFFDIQLRRAAAAPRFYFSFVVRVSDQGGEPITGTEMKKVKRFVLITLAVCVTIDLFVVWMLW
jgi:hypothetical protein